jgi:hypothetical protein
VKSLNSTQKPGGNSSSASGGGGGDKGVDSLDVQIEVNEESLAIFQKLSHRLGTRATIEEFPYRIQVQ